MYTLSKRLGAEEEKDQMMAIDGGAAEKRMRNAQGQTVVVNRSAPAKQPGDPHK